MKLNQINTIIVLLHLLVACQQRLEKSSELEISTSNIVYGDDQRVDIESIPEQYAYMKRSVAARVAVNDLEEVRARSGVSLYNIKYQQTIGERYGLCADQKLAQVPSVSSCSGFLIAPDLLMTAGHCVYNQNECDSYAWVFDFDQAHVEQNLNEKLVKVLKRKVYRCVAIERFKKERYIRNTDSGEDYAIIRLDREVLFRTPLALRRDGIVSSDAALAYLGHPNGGLAQYADGAQILNNSFTTHFTATLDSFSGNSGAPVINLDEGVVEGILVRGGADYRFNGEKNCREINQVTNFENVIGEGVTRISIIEDLDTLMTNL